PAYPKTAVQTSIVHLIRNSLDYAGWRDRKAVAQALRPIYVLRITALSRSSLYRRIAAGDFPAPVSLGGRAKGWRRAALLEWIDDPVSYRPLTHCVKETSSAGGRVRRVAAATSQS